MEVIQLKIVKEIYAARSLSKASMRLGKATSIVSRHLSAFEKECGIKVTQVTDARTYAQMKQYVQSGNVPWDIGGTRA